MEDIKKLRTSGLSITAISQMTGYDRKTIRKHLLNRTAKREYGPRPPRPGKLDNFKAYIQERLQAGVWNAVVLLREIRERGYAGGYGTVKEYLQPQRQAARTVAVRRFETPAGKQAQVDWGHLGSIDMDGVERKVWGFTFTLGHSRAMMAEAALEQKLGTLLRMHEEAFRQLGGVPEEILYDRMKTVWLNTDDRGEIVWHPVFLDFSRYWGFRPRLCRPYRAQTKGKVESGVKYVRRNFLCGLQGQEPSGLGDLNTRLRSWVWEVANQRVHGTTHQVIRESWEAEKQRLGKLDGRPAYPYTDDEMRKVSRDAFVAWQSNRYSVPWQHAGREVWVREKAGQVEVHWGGEQVATHPLAGGKHRTIVMPDHHSGIPLSAPRTTAKIQIHFREMAPEVEVRPLAAYEAMAGGGVL